MMMLMTMTSPSNNDNFGDYGSGDDGVILFDTLAATRITVMKTMTEAIVLLIFEHTDTHRIKIILLLHVM